MGLRVLHGQPQELQTRWMDGAGRFDHLTTDAAEKPFWVVLSAYLPVKVREHVTIAHQWKADCDDAASPTLYIMMCVCLPIYILGVPRHFLWLLSALHLIPTPLPTGLNLDQLSALLPFVTSFTGLWEWSGCETPMDLTVHWPCFRVAVALLSLFLRVPMTLHHQVELFGPGPRWSSGLRAFGGVFLDLAVSLMGRVQAKGEETPYFSHKNSCHFAEGETCEPQCLNVRLCPGSPTACRGSQNH